MEKVTFSKYFVQKCIYTNTVLSLMKERASQLHSDTKCIMTNDLNFDLPNVYNVPKLFIIFF